jgi:hypothetical protein
MFSVVVYRYSFTSCSSPPTYMYIPKSGYDTYASRLLQYMPSYARSELVYAVSLYRPRTHPQHSCNKHDLRVPLWNAHGIQCVL